MALDDVRLMKESMTLIFDNFVNTSRKTLFWWLAEIIERAIRGLFICMSVRIGKSTKIFDMQGIVWNRVIV